MNLYNSFLVNLFLYLDLVLKKKVLHIISSLNDGGAEALLYRICIKDNSLSHVVISLSDIGKYGPFLKSNNIPVHALSMSKNLSFIYSFIHLFNLIKSYKPDVVQTWLYHADFLGGIAARLAGVKNIFWGVHHTNLNFKESKLTTIIISKINSFLSFFIPKKIIYCALSSRIANESIGYVKSKGIVIYNGYDSKKFDIDNYSRLHFRNSLNISNKTFFVGHVGRFHPYKDYSTLIKSFSLVPKNCDIKFLLVGTDLDNDNPELVSLINSYNLNNNVILFGRSENVKDVMNGIDLFILSSNSEAFPNVLNESMLCGTPCITTDVGDAKIIVDKYGVVVDIADYTSLSEGIIKMYDEFNNDVPNWLKRCNNSRSFIIHNYELDLMIKQYNMTWFGN